MLLEKNCAFSILICLIINILNNIPHWQPTHLLSLNEMKILQGFFFCFQKEDDPGNLIFLMEFPFFFFSLQNLCMSIF